MLVIGNQVFGLALRVIEHIFDTSRGCTGHRVAEFDFPLQRRPRLQCRMQLRNNHRMLLGALAHTVVAIIEQIQQARLFAQRSPEMRCVGRQIEVAFARRVDAGDAARTHVAVHFGRFVFSPDQSCRLHGQGTAQ